MKMLDSVQAGFEKRLLDRLFPASFALRADAEWRLEQWHHANGLCSENQHSGGSNG